MPEVVKVLQHSEAHIRIRTERGIAMELSERFTFTVPGWNFMPAAKFGWDGKIRLFDVNKGLLYAGLKKRVEDYCKEAGYVFEDETTFYGREYVETKTSITPYQYQIDTVKTCIEKGRRLVLSPTGSGKSLVIYKLIQQYSDMNVLIIVPTIQLVSQMTKDFISYGCEEPIHGITGGVSKDSNARIVVTTWQSITKVSSEWLAQYPCIIVDEAHTAKAKSISSIMEKAVRSPYRFGFTGTLDGTLTNQMVLEGLFGPVYKATTTAELIKDKKLSPVDIVAILLEYSDEYKKVGSKLKYADEMKFLINNPARLKVVCDMVLATKGASLVLFQYKTHGQAMYDYISSKTERPVFLIHGGIDIIERELARESVADQDPILVASYGTTQAGINAPNLRNLFITGPTKSVIRLLQSLGRVVRLSNGKLKARLFDIGDDLRYGQKVNHTLRHFNHRLKIYSTEGFDYKNIKIDLTKVKV